jgi:AcrR family transcriptional regulator
VPQSRSTPAPKSVDPRPARRQRRFEQILAAAWDVAGEEGLTAVSLHEVARRVGIRQPSLYTYIDSKMALYDAMFGQAAHALLDRVTQHDLPHEPRAALREGTRVIADYALENPTAGQLLFNRTIPGFEPSPASYAPAVELLSRWGELLSAAGVTDPGDVDIFTGVVGGLMQQQQSNEPGGNRYISNLDRVIDMYFDYIDGHREPGSAAAERSVVRPHQNPSTEDSPSPPA